MLVLIIRDWVVGPHDPLLIDKTLVFVYDWEVLRGNGMCLLRQPL